MKATVLVTLASAGLLLAGCSSDSSGSQSPTTTAATSVTSTTTATSAPTKTEAPSSNPTTTAATTGDTEPATFKTSSLRSYLAANDPAAAALISPSGGITISDSSSDPRRGSVTVVLVDGSDQAAALMVCEAASGWAYPLKPESTVQIKVADAVVVKRVSEAGSCAPSSG